MINNYDIAVLSEKVAYLEAAIKNAGIELPGVTTDDNGKTLQVVAGKWDKGNKIPGVVNALDSTSITDALSAAQGKALDDKLKEVTSNLSDGSVDLSEYTSAYYTCPSDGYLVVNSNSSTTGVIRAKVSDTNNTAIAYAYMTVVGDYQVQSVFVKKGMKLNVSLNNTNDGSIVFNKLK